MKIARKFRTIEKDETGYIIQTEDLYFKLIFLTDDIIRVRASLDPEFEESSYVLVTTGWKDRFDELIGAERVRVKPLDIGYVESERELVFQTKTLIIKLMKQPFQFKIFDLEGKEKYSDLKGRSYVQNKIGQMIHYSKIDEKNDFFYGFGEQTGILNKRYESIKLNPKDAYMYDAEKTNPMYKHIPFYIKLNKISKHAFGMFYNNTYECEFNLAKERNNYFERYTYFKAEGGDIDWFFINGPSVYDVVRRYTDLTGKTVLPPIYSLGYIGSTMYYAELDEDCDDAILDFINKNRREEIPIDCFHLSSGYTVGSDGLRYTFNWNFKRFKDPRNFLEQMETKGVPVSPNIKPGLLTTHPYYDQYDRNNGFIKDSKGNSYVDYWWGGLGSFVDFSAKMGREIWKRHLTENLLDYGIKSIWNDNCEYEIGDDTAVCDFDGKPIQAKAIKSILPNLMAKVAYDSLLEKYPTVRPFVVNRSGFSGFQRYASTWAGDNLTEWKTIKYNTATILGMGLSGVAHNGCDVSGFGGAHPEAELFLRWVQNGIFMPRFSIHSSNNDNTVTEPWMYPSIKDKIKRAILLRYQFIPYLYSLMFEASTVGTPIMRPLFYEFQSDEETYDESFHFMFGPFILVANVFEKGEKIKEIYLPEGVDWYEWETHKKYKAGTQIQYDVDLDTIPIFIRGGAIIPIVDQLKNLHQDIVTEMKFLIALKENVEFILYEDDGKSNEYKKGIYRETKICVKIDDCVKVSFEKRGSYESPVETLILEMINEQRGAFWAKVGGEKIKQFLDYDKWEECQEGWFYSAQKQATFVKLKNRNQDFEVEVSFELFDLIGMTNQE